MTAPLLPKPFGAGLGVPAAAAFAGGTTTVDHFRSGAALPLSL